MERDDIIITLRRFIKMNRERYNIIKIGFFGSAARGGMDDQSDIDVVVELGKQDLFNIIGIKQDLEEQFSIPVDVVSYRQKMNQFLKKRIDKEVIYV